MRWRDWVWMKTRPPQDRWRDERGWCSICGRTTKFMYNRWAVSPSIVRDLNDSSLLEPYRRRESMWCSVCGASQRERHLISVLLLHYSREARSLADLVAEDEFRLLDIAEINRLNAAHPFLDRLPKLRYSEYPEEDIQALSYADESFDLVVTGDTLEHVPDYEQALRETRRVLRPSGRHIFTTPTRPDFEETRSRAGLPPVYHGEAPGPLRWLSSTRPDMRVLHDFGRDLSASLDRAGFVAELHGDGQNVVYCARRPELSQV